MQNCNCIILLTHYSTSGLEKNNYKIVFNKLLILPHSQTLDGKFIHQPSTKFFIIIAPSCKIFMILFNFTDM